MNASKNTLNTRAVAARILIEVLPFNRPNYHGRSLSEVLPRLGADCDDRSLLQELCFGVCRWYTRLDKLSASLVKQPFKPKDADIHALLLIGLYQLYYLRIPDHAAISETVEAGRQLNKKWAVNVLNGMLRSGQRQKQTLTEQLPDSIAIQQAHPQWLVDTLGSAWPEQLSSLLQANNEPGPMCLRVNLQRQSRDDFLHQLKIANIEAAAGNLAPSAVYLNKPMPVDAIPTFADGGVSVQDEAAQLSAFFLAPQPGDRILDACAAPGGKTCHLLEHQPAIGHLIAIDQEASRLERVQENLQRLQLQAECICASLEDYIAAYNGPLFDRILLDAPCSSTGVIRRHPDIKWLRKRSDIAALATTQSQLLRQVYTLLKPGGVLLYATCSVLPQENERVISAFLGVEATATLDPLTAATNSSAKVGLQLLPKKSAHDGFYYARLHHNHSLC